MGMAYAIQGSEYSATEKGASEYAEQKMLLCYLFLDSTALPAAQLTDQEAVVKSIH